MKVYTSHAAQNKDDVLITIHSPFIGLQNKHRNFSDMRELLVPLCYIQTEKYFLKRLCYHIWSWRGQGQKLFTRSYNWFIKRWMQMRE